MDRSRREVIGVVGSGLLAGCTGASVPSVPNPLGGGGSGGSDAAATSGPERSGSGGDSSATATPNATTTGTATPAAGAGETTTRRVFDEVSWFATEYDPATAEFRALAGRMENLADGLSRRSSITSDAVETLRRLAGRVETTVEDRLGPHFDASPSLVADTRERIDRIETLRARGDWDGVSAALSALRERYATVGTESYVARTFPRDPVRGPLVRYVAGNGHADDVLLVAYHVGADAVVRAQQNLGTYPRTAPGGREDVARYRTLFGPLAAGPGGAAVGDAGAYLTVTSLVGGGTVPLSVRQYRDPATAGTAVDELLSGAVTGEGTTRFGEREWRRVFYRSDGDVMYADLTRAGSFVLVAGPSRRPWEDRPSDWPTPLKLTWLWEAER